ncbi:MAG: carbohydrate-binding domain-containing protein [Thermomicrobiales bacterium]
MLITGLGFLLVTYPGANGVDAAQVSQSTAGIEDLEIDDSASNIDWDALPTTSVELSDEDLTITEAGTYVLTGSSTASVIVDATDLDVRLVLSGVEINSSTNAAIVVADAETVVIQLASDTSQHAERRQHTCRRRNRRGPVFLGRFAHRG